jgi:hypothetical protein
MKNKTDVTLHDHFAGQALIGILNDKCATNDKWKPEAHMAFDIADAMIACRNKRKENAR